MNHSDYESLFVSNQTESQAALTKQTAIKEKVTFNEAFDSTNLFQRSVSDIAFHYRHIYDKKKHRKYVWRPPGMTLSAILKGKMELALEGVKNCIIANQNNETTTFSKNYLTGLTRETDISTRVQCFAFNLASPTLWQANSCENNVFEKII